MDDRIKLTIENLRALDFVGKSSHENLSNICKAFCPDVDRIGIGWTRDACEKLREIFIGWLSEYEPDDWADGYLDEVGLMRLPKDADGKVIHVGDVMRWPDGVTFNVAGVGNGVFFYNDRDGAWCTSASDKTHYHKPTIEEILREFGDEVQRCCDTENTIAEYAAKLRELMADE